MSDDNKAALEALDRLVADCSGVPWVDVERWRLAIRAALTRPEPRVVEVEARDKAIKYMVRRIIEDPNVHYYCGYGTEVFRLMVLAVAEIQNRPAAEVEAEFATACKDVGEPDVERLERELEERK